jgi:hypothetical protein
MSSQVGNPDDLVLSPHSQHACLTSPSFPANTNPAFLACQSYPGTLSIVLPGGQTKASMIIELTTVGSWDGLQELAEEFPSGQGM